MNKKIILIIISCILLVTGCFNATGNDDLKDNNAVINKTVDTKDDDDILSNIKVTINNKTYTLNLEDNETVREFINILPQEFNMSDLNGNEKYVYIDNPLPTNSYNPKYIEKGDIMLFGNNCLVIFYKSFDANYSYTKIGHIDNLDNFGSGSIIAKFEK